MSLAQAITTQQHSVIAQNPKDRAHVAVEGPSPLVTAPSPSLVTVRVAELAREDIIQIASTIVPTLGAQRFCRPSTSLHPHPHPHEDPRSLTSHAATH